MVDIDHPAPAAGEVLLDVSYCGICGSDLHMLGMPAGMLPPGHVLGHEFTAVIAELGPHAEGWAVGDRVVVFPMIACGECAAAPVIPTCAAAASTGALASVGREGTPNRSQSRRACCGRCPRP